MNTFIILLRGVNVSGSNILKMAELRKALNVPEFVNVQTYIQSGNIVLQSDLGSEDVERTVDRIIRNQFELAVPMFVLSPEYVAAIIENMPFAAEANPSRVILTFFSTDITDQDIIPLSDLKSPEEEMIRGNRMIYFHFPSGSGKSRLSNANIEKKLNQVCTSRNQRTMVKLLEMSD